MLPAKFIVFCSKQPNICTFSWHISCHADLGLFSSQKFLNVAREIQPGTGEITLAVASKKKIYRLLKKKIQLFL